MDPRHTSEDVTAKVKASLDVVKMGIGVNSLRKGRGQKILVGCDTAAGQKSFRDAVASLNVGLSAESQPLRNPLLKLAGVVRDMTDAKLIEAIISQNKGIIGDLEGEVRELRVVRRSRPRTPEITNAIIQVSPTLWKCLNNQKLRIGYQVVPFFDQSPVVQCFSNAIL